MRDRSPTPRSPIQPAVSANGACWRRQAVAVCSSETRCDTATPDPHSETQQSLGASRIPAIQQNQTTRRPA